MFGLGRAYEAGQTGALVASTIQEKLFIAGLSFSTRGRVTVTPATNVYIHLDASALVGLR